MTTDSPVRVRRRRASAADQSRIAAGQVGATAARLIGAVGARTAPLGRVVASRVRPVLGVVSTLGWIVFAFAAVCLILAVWLGWAEFLFIAVTLLAALLIAAAFVFGRSTYRVDIELNPRRVVAGDRALGRLSVVNSGVRPVLPTPPTSSDHPLPTTLRPDRIRPP